MQWRATWNVWLGLGALLLLCPARAWAGAGGTLEADEEYELTPQAYLRWRTGDACQNAEACFQVTPVAERPGMFRSLFGEPVRALAADRGTAVAPPLATQELWKIGVPEAGTSRILGQLRSEKGDWFAYDLATGAYLAPPGRYEDVLARWKTAGLTEPAFEQANLGVRRLPQTLRSRLESAAPYSLVVVPLLAVLGAAFAMFRRRRQGASP